MGKLIPYFYYDIVARIAPGALVIVLSKLLIPSEWLRPWASWIGALNRHSALAVVLVPVICGGIAYVIGLLLDLFCSRLLNRWAITPGFCSALRDYKWCYPAEGFSTDASTEGDLAHWSFDWYLTHAPPAEFPHGQRFHGEAKFFFHVASVLVLFVFLVTFCKPDLFAKIAVGGPLVIFVSVAALVGVLLFAAYYRSRRRALRLLSFFDHANDYTANGKLEKLKQRIETFQAVFNTLSGKITSTPSQEDQEVLAYWIWEKRGRRMGFQDDDWMQAQALFRLMREARQRAESGNVLLRVIDRWRRH